MSKDLRIFRHRQQALGEQPCDLVLKNARLVNVLSGRIEDGVDIGIAGSRVVGVGAGYQGAEELDMGGQFVYPGLIDAHIHIESSKLTIPQLGRLLNRHGTTTLFADPHEIANVASIEGISYLLDTAAHNGRLGIYFNVPSSVPALPDPEIETYASYLGPTKLSNFFTSRWFVTLGEVMNVPGALYGDEKLQRKIHHYLERRLPVDGHAPMVRGRGLNTYVYMGMRSDHESTSAAEAQEKLDRGMRIMIRQGSTEENLQALLPIVTAANCSRTMFCTDDIEPIDLVKQGHINNIVRMAVRSGLDPIMALQMATIFPATYFNIRDIGAIFPGSRADIVVSPDLERFEPSMVVRGGSVVFRDGQDLPVGRESDRYLRSTMNCQLPNRSDLRVPACSRIRVIQMVPGQIVTQQVTEAPTVVDGNCVADPQRDLLKICVFDRHRDSGSFSVGFVRGFGLRRGAIASTVSHDSHNLVAVGVDDADILTAAELVRATNGGQAAVCGDASVLLPLPVGGLMSDATWEDVVAMEQRLHGFAKEELGCALRRPFGAASFLSLPVIPELKITDRGLVEVLPGQYPRRVSLAV